MSATTIEWTDVTLNPTTGCDRVSPGCDNCYALTLAKRLKAMGSPRYQNDGDPRTSGPGFGLTLHPDDLDAPLRWRKPRMVFVNSMSDLFHKEVPDEYLDDVWQVMRMASWHTFQILTKRPQRMQAYAMSTCASAFDCQPAANVWLGASVENDTYAWRANYVSATPAAVRFLSLEPLLGPLPSLNLVGIDWVIVGGESGPGARPMDPEWAQDIVDSCQTAGIPVFVKQMGGKGGKAHHDINTFPEGLRVRQTPQPVALIGESA